MSFVYSEEEMKLSMARIKSYGSLMASPGNASAFDITQFLRGELFVLIDCLLTTNFALKYMQRVEVQKPELAHILEVCDAYCALYGAWLSALPGFFDAVLLLAS